MPAPTQWYDPETILVAGVTAIVLGFVLVLTDSRGRRRHGKRLAAIVLFLLGGGAVALAMGWSTSQEAPPLPNDPRAAGRGLPPLRELPRPALTDRGNPIAEFLITTTEPILAPLRRVIPRMGMMDMTPLVATLILYAIGRALNSA